MAFAFLALPEIIIAKFYGYRTYYVKLNDINVTVTVVSSYQTDCSEEVTYLQLSFSNLESPG